jgi:hypothetical protein
MTITTTALKKAGESVAKKTVLRPPRAVTVAEARAQSVAEPTRIETTTTHPTTMQPWKGWFSRFLQETIGEDNYRKMRETVFFMPSDIYDLQPAPNQSKAIRISKTDPSITARYRYPSPGSQVPTRQPEFEATEDPYDTGYFKRDTRRRYLSSEQMNPAIETLKVELMTSQTASSESRQEELTQIASGPASSPGNKNIFATGPSNFDPTGLRATMSVNWTSLNKSLDENMPDHLPTPTWVGHEDEIKQWYTERDLPVPIGGYYSALNVPVERRVARW